MKPATVFRYFDTYAEYRLALATLFGSSRQQVVLVERDLRETALATRSGIELIGGFLAASPRRRLRIVLHDLRFLEGECARLMSLCSRYRHAITVRATPDHLRHLTECYAAGDGKHLVTRFHADHARGKLMLNHQEVGGWAFRFEDLWQECHEDLPGTPLGL